MTKQVQLLDTEKLAALGLQLADQVLVDKATGLELFHVSKTGELKLLRSKTYRKDQLDFLISLRDELVPVDPLFATVANRLGTTLGWWEEEAAEAATKEVVEAAQEAVA